MEPASDHFDPPPVSTWPNAPVLVTQPRGDGARSVVHIHKPGANEESEFSVESDAFSGKMYVAIKGINNYPESYFSGKRRLFNVVVQGRFQRPDISFAAAKTGQIFSSPLHLMPPEFMVAPFKFLIEKLQPCLQMNLAPPRPYMVSPLMSTMQIIVASTPGSEPDISTNYRIQEDLSLLGPEFEGMSPDHRKEYFSDRMNLGKFHFDPALVYTFNFYQDLLDLSSFEFKAGLLGVDISRFLGRLPVSIIAAVFTPGEHPSHQESTEGVANEEKSNIETKGLRHNKKKSS